MYWNHNSHGIYTTLPMQAALHLYLPHVVESSELPHQELFSQYPDETPQLPAVRKSKHTHYLW